MKERKKRKKERIILNYYLLYMHTSSWICSVDSRWLDLRLWIGHSVFGNNTHETPATMYNHTLHNMCNDLCVPVSVCVFLRECVARFVCSPVCACIKKGIPRVALCRAHFLCSGNSDAFSSLPAMSSPGGERGCQVSADQVQQTGRLCRCLGTPEQRTP